MVKGKKILVVSATKKSEEDFKNTPLGGCVFKQEELGNVDSVQISYNNSKGLGTVYNKYINKRYKNYIILFCHDDIILHDYDLKAKANETIKKYDVFGVAGSSFHTLVRPVLWACGGREHHGGAVTHFRGDDVNQPFCSSFGVRDKRVYTLDGLFIGVNVEKALSVDLKFDEQFDFHFYDLDFSVGANELGLMVGVYPFHITHYSHGNPSDGLWKIRQEQYIKKWAVK